MRISNTIKTGVTMVVLITALAACSEDMSDLERFVAETKQKHQGEVEPLPEIEPYRSFSYNAALLDDPFVIEQDIEAQPTGPKPDEGRRKEPLEAFPLDSLKMVGILQQDNTRWGLIKDSDGTIHRVQPGNYAGENDGKILTVSETKISISELIPDGQGAWVDREASLTLGDE
ncbi:MAG: pilus assembly protein PilP [Pseudomonadota bacterium]